MSYIILSQIKIISYILLYGIFSGIFVADEIMIGVQLLYPTDITTLLAEHIQHYEIFGALQTAHDNNFMSSWVIQIS